MVASLKTPKKNEGKYYPGNDNVQRNGRRHQSSKAKRLLGIHSLGEACLWLLSARILYTCLLHRTTFASVDERAPKMVWKMVRAKCSIILTFGSYPLLKLVNIIDDDNKTAKDLSYAVVKLYLSSNSQLIINLEQELEALRFDDNGNWETHLRKFQYIMGKLSTYNSPFKKEKRFQKCYKLYQTLLLHSWSYCRPITWQWET